MTLNLAAPLREAILGMSSITDLLGTYAGEPSIHTRRPVPAGATYPMVVVSPDIFSTDFDGLTVIRNAVMRDLAVYGQSLDPAQDDDYRVVEEIGYGLRERFHRRKEVLYVEGYNVVDIVAAGPIPAPTGDDRLVGRVVTLTIRLSKRA